MSLNGRKKQRMGSSAFTEGEVARIKAALKAGHSPRSLAEDHDVALETIRKIGRGDTFAWVEADEYAVVNPADEFLSTPLSPELKAAADASAAELMQRIAEREAAEAEHKRRMEELLGRMPVSKAEPTPGIPNDPSPDLIRRRAEADRRMQETLAQRTGLGLEEIQKRWIDCKGDREAIARLVNELHRFAVMMANPVALETRLEGFINEGDPQ